MADKLEEINIVTILTGLCQLLSQESLTLEEIRSELALFPLEASVAAEPGTETPAYVRLVLPDSSQPELDSFQKAFGTFNKVPRMHRQAGDKYIQTIDSPGKPYTCALIAETEMDQHRVRAVVVRRDIRLE